MSLVVFDADATRRALPFPDLIDALRRAFAAVAGAEVPRRHVHTIAAADSSAVGTVLLMPAWRSGGRFGLKTVSIFPGNANLGLPALHSSYLLHDARTGAPLAMLDGDQITARRTAAASALATSFLARPDASRLLVVGAGRVAALMPEAMAVVRPISRVTVWARRPDAAEALASSWRDRGFDAHVARDLEAAVRAADIVSCATLATQPLVHGAWLGPGSHLDLIGGFTPAMRESDAACFDGAAVWVDTDDALEKAGDVLEAVATGRFTPAALRGTLASLCRGASTGRRNDVERTLFKSVGSALEDLAAAELVVDGGPLS